MGDFNYKLENIDMSSALKMLRNGNLSVLRAHDTMSEEIRSGRSFHGCVEPIPQDNFFPTYKKIEKRPQIFDQTRPDDYYITVFKKPWYKRSMVVEKIPAFTDRIFVHSINSFKNDIRPFKGKNGTHQYGCFEPDLIGSDHSPIFSILEINVRFSEKMRKPQRLRIKILSVKIGVENCVEEFAPESSLFMFPAPFEDGNERGKPIAVNLTNIKKSQIAVSKSQAHKLKKKMAKSRKEKARPMYFSSAATSEEDLQNSSSKAVRKAGLRVSLNYNVKRKLLLAASKLKSPMTPPTTASEEASLTVVASKSAQKGMWSKEKPNLISSLSVIEQFPEVKMEWSTFSVSPVLHLVARFLVDGKVGQCSVPTPFGCFAYSHVVEAKELLCESGIPMLDAKGKRYYARFLLGFTLG